MTAREAITAFRDATRAGRVVGFRERDELVVLLHNELDALEARADAAEQKLEGYRDSLKEHIDIARTEKARADAAEQQRDTFERALKTTAKEAKVLRMEHAMDLGSPLELSLRRYEIVATLRLELQGAEQREQKLVEALSGLVSFIPAIECGASLVAAERNRWESHDTATFRHMRDAAVQLQSAILCLESAKALLAPYTTEQEKP